LNTNNINILVKRTTKMNQVEELTKAADQLRHQGLGNGAADKYEQAAALELEAGNVKGAAACWHMAGVSLKETPGRAEAALKKAGQFYEQAGDALGAGRVYRDLGIMYGHDDQFGSEALSWLEKSESALRNTPTLAELGITVVKIGYALLLKGDLRGADRRLREGLELIRHQGQWFYEATALMHLAELKLEIKEYSALTTYCWAALGALAKDKPELGYDQLIIYFGRRSAELHGLLAHGYLGLGNEAEAARFYESARELTKPMKSETAQLVRRKIRAEELERRLV